jgi:hypothetical protein
VHDRARYNPREVDWSFRRRRYVWFIEGMWKTA